VSALGVGDGLTLADARAMMREATKDKSYILTPIGQEVDQFMRSLRWQGAPKNTLDTYEHVLVEALAGFR